MSRYGISFGGTLNVWCRYIGGLNDTQEYIEKIYRNISTV